VVYPYQYNTGDLVTIEPRESHRVLENAEYPDVVDSRITVTLCDMLGAPVGRSGFNIPRGTVGFVIKAVDGGADRYERRIVIITVYGTCKVYERLVRPQVTR
jgi:hypothetical protein